MTPSPSPASLAPTRILYLGHEIMGYTMATINALVEAGAELHLINNDQIKLTPFAIPETRNVTVHHRSTLCRADLLALADRFQPTICVVSGWRDADYRAAAKRLRERGCKTVLMVDNQWAGTLRQRLGIIANQFGYLSNVFTHGWVSGKSQYEFVRRLGFAPDAILHDLYSADTQAFGRAYHDAMAVRANAHPHRFLYVGRFAPVKGLDVLVKAWTLLGDARGDWGLTLIGNGPLKDQLNQIDNVTLMDFLQPEDLVKQISGSGCFVLPSLMEPWGVVVHEFAAAGLPLILSDSVGARSTFLVPGLNGARFASGDAADLADQMARIVRQPDATLAAMGRASHQLAQRITPQTSAANLLSVIAN